MFEEREEKVQSIPLSLFSFRIDWFDLRAVQGDLVKTLTSGLTRPVRYDLNQIPYNYTVDVTN